MSDIAKRDPEPFIIDPEPTPLGQAAAIICGHDVIQALGVEGMCAFHGFVQEVLATEIEPELKRKDREIARLEDLLNRQKARTEEEAELRGNALNDLDAAKAEIERLRAHLEKAQMN